MTSWHPDQRRPAGAHPLAGRRRSWLAPLPVFALVVLVVPAHAYAASALARTTDALTGRRDAAQLTAQDLCRPPSPSRSTCDAQMLAPRAGEPVHPRRGRPAAAGL